MSEYITQTLRRLKLARVVNHYYFMYTDGDMDSGQVSVDNIEKIVAAMSKCRIEKVMNDEPSEIIRSKYIRWDDNTALIVLSEGQEDYWIRFCVVKELCHILCDQEDEYQPDVDSVLKELLEPNHSLWKVFKNGSTIQRIEKIAEVIALELIYPLEFRKVDCALIENGETTIKKLAQQRGVPPVHVQQGVDPDWIDTMTDLWAVISDGERIPDLDI